MPMSNLCNVKRSHNHSGYDHSLILMHPSSQRMVSRGEGQTYSPRFAYAKPTNLRTRFGIPREFFELCCDCRDLLEVSRLKWNVVNGGAIETTVERRLFYFISLIVYIVHWWKEPRKWSKNVEPRPTLFDHWIANYYSYFYRIRHISFIFYTTGRIKYLLYRHVKIRSLSIVLRKERKISLISIGIGIAKRARKGPAWILKCFLSVRSIRQEIFL